LHDVAPATWLSCRRVLAAIREVADIPVTLLVVPAYWGRCSALVRGFENAMTHQLERGNELALHGYFHQDLGVPRSALDWVRRRVYTAGEGEFCALGEQEAAERLLLGQRWFAANRWPLFGFVPPAWLLGPEAWKAVRACPQIQYVTTFSQIHALRAGMSIPAPCLTFSSRTPWRRVLSFVWASAGLRQCQASVVRLALHPRDATFSSLRHAWQARLASLLEDREAVTKAEFVRRAVSSEVEWQHHRFRNLQQRQRAPASVL
jgi:predicted deacetylase